MNSRKKSRSAERALEMFRKKPTLALALRSFSQQLDAAEQQHVVDRGHQAEALGDVEILLEHQHLAVRRLDPRIAFEEAALPLRQADDRLQGELDPVLAQPSRSRSRICRSPRPCTTGGIGRLPISSLPSLAAARLRGLGGLPGSRGAGLRVLGLSTTRKVGGAAGIAGAAMGAVVPRC